MQLLLTSNVHILQLLLSTLSPLLQSIHHTLKKVLESWHICQQKSKINIFLKLVALKFNYRIQYATYLYIVPEYDLAQTEPSYSNFLTQKAFELLSGVCLPLESTYLLLSWLDEVISSICIAWELIITVNEAKHAAIKKTNSTTGKYGSIHMFIGRTLNGLKSESRVTRERISHMDHIKMKLKTNTGPDKTKEAFLCVWIQNNFTKSSPIILKSQQWNKVTHKPLKSYY